MKQGPDPELLADATVEARRFLARVKPRKLRTDKGRAITTAELAEELILRSALEHAVVDGTRPTQVFCDDCGAVVVPKEGRAVPKRCHPGTGCRAPRMCVGDGSGSCPDSLPAGQRSKSQRCRRCSRAATGRSMMVAFTPEQRAANAQKGAAALTQEQRRVATDKIVALTFEQRSARAKKAAAAFTHEQHVEHMARASAALTKEQRAAGARKAAAGLTPEQRSARNKNLQPGGAGLTQEQRSAKTKKAWITRRAKKPEAPA